MRIGLGKKGLNSFTDQFFAIVGKQTDTDERIYFLIHTVNE